MKHGQTTEQESKTPDILSAIESAETQLTNRNYNTVIENIRATIASDREFTRRRQRETQRRYRKRIDDRAVHLAKNTNQLKSEIQKLTVKHQVLLAGVPSKTTPWSVVVSYYDLFQNGLKQPKHLQKIKNTQDSNGVHKNFLHTVMNPKVSVNAGFGADAVLEDWRLLAQNIEDLDVRIVRLENVDENNIIAYVRGTTTITEAMLRNEFPHLWYDGDGNIWSSFAERLLGRQLVVYTTTRFVWDSSASRIVSAHYTVDLETAMMNLLGNWEDVAYILSMPCTAQGTRRWTGVFE
ncbi:hypothetical protein PHMEG_00014185 [Phytophthora megakarya]|uniref:Uncharacterized protein n=1 Tax=Phytophthora megakarya TaxID=4795 RepID=A0A225W6I3_9STRA|nr:hypothetical protein PHMEG_00014185 [Phytophthora megakarya]